MTHFGTQIVVLPLLSNEVSLLDFPLWWQYIKLKKKKSKKESKMQFCFSIMQVSEILFKTVYFPKVLQASILDSSLHKQQ